MFLFSFRPPRWCPSGWAPTWRLHSDLYKFRQKASPNILHKKNCCDLNLGESFCIVTFFLFSDSGLDLLNGFDFYFDLFWMAWHWKPAIVWHVTASVFMPRSLSVQTILACSLKWAFFLVLCFFWRKLMFAILLSTSKVLLTINFLSKTYLKRLGQAFLRNFSSDQIVIELTKISK